MTMTYTKDGDGYIVHDHNQRAVCRVKTTNAEFLPEHKLPDGRVIPPQAVEKALPRDQWLFHFCAGRFTAQQIKDTINMLPQAESTQRRPMDGE